MPMIHMRLRLPRRHSTAFAVNAAAFIVTPCVYAKRVSLIRAIATPFDCRAAIRALLILMFLPPPRYATRERDV